MKKILNIFASISLITTGASSVVACGSGTKTSANDQNLVNDVIHRLDKQTFSFDENKNGSKTFGDYKTSVLQEIRSKLTEQEKGLVKFPASDDSKRLNADNLTDIDVNVQSHNIYQDIDIFVKLNYDAQSIADKISAQKTITVFQTGGYKKSELANKYKPSIQSQINNLLNSDEKQSGYKISNLHEILDNTNISWPYWDKNKREEVYPDKQIPLTIQVGQDKASSNITLEFKFYQEKEILDDPSEGSSKFPAQIYTNGKSITSTKEWNENGINTALNSWWSFGDFQQYVSYDKTSKLIYGEEYNPKTKKKEKIRNQVKMYCPLFGKTKTSPRAFYVVLY